MKYVTMRVVAGLSAVLLLSGAAMAAGASQHCFGAACPDQIGCAPTAPPSASSTSLVHPIALALVGAAPDVNLTPVSAWPDWLSALSPNQGLIAPSAPRSPPFA